MTKKSKKKWQPDEEAMPRWQKLVIAGTLSFIPFFFLVILPMLSRDHFVKELKIPAEIFLGSPQLINLVGTSEVPATYKVNINGYEFKIPDSFTPTRINKESAEFSIEPRREAKHIFILAQKDAKTLDFTKSGFTRWFIPSTLQGYLQTILRASWHPVRLMFKAQFYAAEGINAPIFEARWDAHHRGFIFPTPGNKGYLGRVFRTNDIGYFEFSYKDSIHSVGLRDWVNLAMRIKTPSDGDLPPDPFSPGTASFGQLSELAEIYERQGHVLGTAMSEFYRTQQVGWLIPVARVMEERKYYRELIELHKQYLTSFPGDSSLRSTWNEIFDRTTRKMLAIDIDPQHRRREMSVHCQNLTDLEITQVWLRIAVTSRLAGEKSFIIALMPHGRLYPNQEKQISIRVPDHINLSDSESIEHRINQIEFSN